VTGYTVAEADSAELADLEAKRTRLVESYIEGLIGTQFNDTLAGSTSLVVNTTLNGLAGDDLLHGWLGNDKVLGGLGNDTLFGDAGNDTLNGGGGTDTLDGGTGTDACTQGETVSNCP